MKTHYVEENDVVNSSNDTADDHCWREHKVRRNELIGDLAILAMTVIGLFVAGYAWNALPVRQDGIAVKAYQPPPTHFAGSRVHPPRGAESDDDR
jgi:hypothetical protein